MLTANPSFLVKLLRRLQGSQPKKASVSSASVSLSTRALFLQSCARNSPRFLTNAIRRVRSYFPEKSNERYIDMTVHLQKSPEGTRYFLFQGTRHFYNPKIRAYQPIQPFSVESLADFHTHREGLTEKEA